MSILLTSHMQKSQHLKNNHFCTSCHNYSHVNNKDNQYYCKRTIRKFKYEDFTQKACFSLTIGSWLRCVQCLTSKLLRPPSADFQEELACGSHKACTWLIWSSCSPPNCPRLTSVRPAAVDQKNSSCRMEAQAAASLGSRGKRRVTQIRSHLGFGHSPEAAARSWSGSRGQAHGRTAARLLLWDQGNQHLLSASPSPQALPAWQRHAAQPLTPRGTQVLHCW